MKHKTCKTCLWWWDLYGTGERKCYRRESPLFHKASKNGCTKYEYPISNRMNMNIGMAYCKTR